MKRKRWIAILLAIMYGYGTSSFFSIASEKDITEIVLSEYQESMAVGEEQKLNIMLLPKESKKEIIYSSSDEKVAKIDETGKIIALQQGTTMISVKCQELEKSFLLTVEDVEKEVKDIEIGEHEESVEVGKTLELSATVLPVDATDTTITYKSNNTEIATVSSTGVVKGMKPGNVMISISAGDIVKEVSLIVKVTTTSIQPDSTYIILKKGESYQLSTMIMPAQADHNIIYKSSNSAVASVSESGVISANALGSTTVIVSNTDMSNAVTVIVNSNTTGIKNSSQKSEKEKEKTQSQPFEELVKKIAEQKDIRVYKKEYPVITQDILEALYENQKSLQIEAKDYILEIHGKDILNYQNELSAEIVLKEEKNGLIFEINQGKNLPGTIYLKMKNVKSYQYVYLYNIAKKKYELIKTEDIGNIKLDTTGTYLLTTDKINDFSINKILIIGAGIIVIGIIIIYILCKKKYWFW